ncbi:MAG: PilN domain-containing protein [Candidatus Latescibacteria bacterium]|nr:PilN domain-containing protein [Candidatus Latescibacterota bacterium]
MLFDHSIFSWHQLRTSALDPFWFQKMRCGLTWGAGQATLTVAGRTRQGVRVVNTVTVPLPDTSIETRTTALTSLRRQHPGYLPPVILGLDSTVLSYQLLTPPDPLPADLPAWVVAQAPRFVPAGLHLDEITLDFRVVQSADQPYIQAVFARRARLEPLIDQVETAGFRVAGVYPHSLAPVDRVHGTIQASALVFCDSDGVTFVPRIDALPSCLHEVAWTETDEETDWSGLAGRIRSLLPSQSDRVTLVTTAAPDSTASGAALADALEQQGVSVTATTGPARATALARAGLDGTRAPFQLLPARPINWAQQEQDRRWALRIAWGGGVLIVLLFVIGLILHQSYARQQRVFAAELTTKAAWIAQVRAFAQMEETLSAELTALRARQAGQDGVAARLEMLGRTVPDQLWLRSLRLERQAQTGQYQARLTGFARTEEALITFLDRVESQARWRLSRALTTSRVDPGTVRQQTGTSLPLIRFELTLATTE